MKFEHIEKNLPDETLKRYWEKMRAYKSFHPMFMSIGEVLLVEYEPNKTVSHEEFKQMGIKPEEKLYLNAKNVGFDGINQNYLYDFEVKPEADFDEVDKGFINNDAQFNAEYTTEKHEFYGLHTYGGFRGFFRPDLNEVINLISRTIEEGELDNIERIYVTTEPYPSNNINECFDSKADRHRAKTTIYVIKKK
jgi:hypothetical protein